MSGVRLGRRAHYTGHIQRIEQPVAPPPLSEQPSACDRDRSLAPTRPPRSSSSPAVKPTAGRSGIQRPESCAAMPGRIEQHVPDRIPNLARCLQHPHVVTIRQQPPSPPERTPHRPQHPPGERLHPTSKGVTIPRLDDQVCVIPQERVVHYPKLPPVAPTRQRLLERPHKRRSPQRRDPLAYPERHVARISRRQIRPTAVTNRRTRPSLASRSLAQSPMPRQRP